MHNLPAQRIPAQLQKEDGDPRAGIPNLHNPSDKIPGGIKAGIGRSV